VGVRLPGAEGRFGATLALALTLAGPALADPAPVDAAAVRLDPENPERETVGKLSYVGGVSLLSPDQRFGGWSGMVASPDGSKLTAISDIGWRMSATIARQDGRIVGLMEIDLAPLAGLDGKPIAGDKENADAEGMALMPDGGIAVGFERLHRVWHYPAARDGTDPLLGVPVAIETPAALAKAGANGGLEALEALPDGSLVGFAEDLPDGKGHHTGWIFGGPAATQPRTLHLDAIGIFKPTDLKRLPSGDLLLLERRYTVTGGPGARLSIIEAAALDGTKPIRSHELAQIPANLTVDNFEALGVWQDAKGGQFAIILSDDNFSAVQRTLLMEFKLP
jgi:hypothetical protein